MNTQIKSRLLTYLAVILSFTSLIASAQNESKVSNYGGWLSTLKQQYGFNAADAENSPGISQSVNCFNTGTTSNGNVTIQNSAANKTISIIYPSSGLGLNGACKYYFYYVANTGNIQALWGYYGIMRQVGNAVSFVDKKIECKAQTFSGPNSQLGYCSSSELQGLMTDAENYVNSSSWNNP